MVEDWGAVTLDPAIPFDKLLIDIKAMHTAKGEGYGTENDDLQNFVDVAYQMSSSPLVACEYLLGKHHAALKQWFRKDDRQQNKVSDDAFLDRAVYAIISLELYRRGHV